MAAKNNMCDRKTNRSGAVDSTRIKELILRHGEEISRLNAHIHETFKSRTKSPEQRRKWQDACAEFHRRYNQLAFPGGYEGALSKIRSGDLNAMEAGICFLECRPYFFRSGYMFKDILRACRHAPLSADQAERLRIIEQKLAVWRKNKLEKKRKEAPFSK